MGYEWSMKFKNRTPDEAISLIQEHFLHKAQNFEILKEGINLLPDVDKMPYMHFKPYDGGLYCIGYLNFYESENTIEELMQLLKIKGFDCTVDEL